MQSAVKDSSEKSCSNLTKQQRLTKDYAYCQTEFLLLYSPLFKGLAAQQQPFDNGFGPPTEEAKDKAILQTPSPD